jgi:glucose-6-phosphate-specific signal transduction histidine kinase
LARSLSQPAAGLPHDDGWKGRIRINEKSRVTVLWAPRILTIAFALFISLFALDVFEEGKGLWRTLIDLLLHLIPMFVLIATLVLAWRRAWIGAVVSVALAALFLWWNFSVRHDTPSRC